jgi:hypothetical protein
MVWRRVRPDQGPVLGSAVQQAKAKSLFHVRLRVTGAQAGEQAAVRLNRKEVYKVAVKDTGEVK